MSPLSASSTATGANSASVRNDRGPKNNRKADMGNPCRVFGIHIGIIWTMYVSQGPPLPLRYPKNLTHNTSPCTPIIWLSNDDKTDTMSIPITQEMLDTIVRAQQVAARAAAAAGDADPDALIVLANISQDADAPFVVAIRDRSVYEWDDEEESVGEYLGFLSVPAAAAADAEEEQPVAEEMTVMPPTEEEWERWERWERWEVKAKVD
jgi:hypothetical protein